MKVIINGQNVETEGKKTILEVAKANGIYIPSLCDHPHLTPFGGCRLCIVEVKGRKGFPPSCSTSVEDGMEVKTETPRLQRLRREILELILSEHPNACLICSEKENCDEYKSTIRKVGETTGCVLCSNNGRCELQDVVETLEITRIRFPSLYREIDVKRSDPFFDRNYNLCILCGRCVRVCHEMRGASTLSFIYRGSQAVVSTVLDKPLQDSGCQFCGACVDVCPTGALAERAIKYEILPEEKAATICPLCSMGCELMIDLANGKILSSKPSEDGVVNRGQACVKGRFAIKDLVYSSKRILKPMIRVKKKLEEVSWEKALDFVAQRFKGYKGDEMALIASSQVTCEAAYVLHKFASQVLKSKNIDSSAGFSPSSVYKETAFTHGIDSKLNFKIGDISKAKTLFLIGADICVSHPLIWLEVLKAVREGARLIVASPTEYTLNRYASQWLKLKPGSDFFLLGYLSKIILEEQKVSSLTQIKGFNSFKNSLGKIDFSDINDTTGLSEDELKEAAKLLLKEEPTLFLFGAGLINYPWVYQNVIALLNLALLSEAQLLPLDLENNLRGIVEVGGNSSGKGLGFQEIIRAVSKGDVKALYLTGPVPFLKKDNLEFLVIQDSFMSEAVDRADVVLPSTTFAETEGTFINVEGRIQKFKKVIEPLGEAKPDWWIVSQLASRMGRKGFSFKNPPRIMKEMSEMIPGFSKISYPKLEKNKNIFVSERKEEKIRFLPQDYSHDPVKADKKYPFLLLIDYNLDYYRNLSLSQEIQGLKVIRDSRWIKIHPDDAKKLKLNSGDNVVIDSPVGKIKGIAKITACVPRRTVGTSLLWNEYSHFSVAGLITQSSQELCSRGLGVIPVKIRRGK